MYRTPFFKIVSGVCVCFVLGHTSMADEPVRDPTMPLGHAPASTTQVVNQWVLHSILIGPGRKLAIINGATLREGQSLPGSAGIKVQRILSQSVVLQQGDQTWVVKLSPSVIKKHSSIQ